MAIGVGDVHRAVHAEAVVLDVDRTRARERRVQHLEVVCAPAAPAGRRAGRAVADDPVVRRPDAEREAAFARHLRRQRLLRHRDGMPGLDAARPRCRVSIRSVACPMSAIAVMASR